MSEAINQIKLQKSSAKLNENEKSIEGVNSEYAVEFRNVTKIYPGSNIKVLDNISFYIKPGEFMILVGPSGCGKSTCLRLLAGLEKVTSGEILIDGKVVNNLEPRNRDISMVFQSYALFPHLTIYDNLAFGLKIKKVKPDIIDKKVREIAALLGLETQLKKKPGQLSGGQRQRVALGRAIIRKAKVFLLDEPLSNLDAKLRAKMRTEIKRIQRKLKIATLYVTHDQVEAMTMGDRIVILNNGKIQQIGTPDEIYNMPANIFSAGFIGSPTMNFYDMKPEKDEKFGLIIKSEDFRFPIPEYLQKYINEEMDLVLAIRPEDIMVLSNTSENINELNNINDEDKLYIMDATIDIVEPIGAYNILHLKVGSSEITCQAENINFKVGQKIKIKFRKDRMHIFDKLTGQSFNYIHKCEKERNDK
ncbi:MAG: ABC transporter ATP-binding protein [Promethearchaeota archaeon]